MSGDYKTGIGSAGEAVVRQWLLDNGYYILPASQIDNMGAPLLLGKDILSVLPDNLTWRDGVPGWVEVKTKSFATEHLTNPKRWEHGIKLNNWVAYDIIQQRTQIPVSIAIIELDTKILLLGLLSDLKASMRIFPMQNILHVFVDRAVFQKQFSLDLPLPEPIKPKALRTILQGKAPVMNRLFML